MYAVIEDSGRQYKVAEGQRIDVDLRAAKAGDAAVTSTAPTPTTTSQRLVILPGPLSGLPSSGASPSLCPILMLRPEFLQDVLDLGTQIAIVCRESEAQGAIGAESCSPVPADEVRQFLGIDWGLRMEAQPDFVRLPFDGLDEQPFGDRLQERVVQ